MEQGKKYDVGIMGFWYGCNYGSIMTYYALNNVVASLGKSVLMLDKHIFVENDVERGATHSRRFAEEHYDISKQYKPEELHELNNICDTFLLGSDQTWNYWISKHFGKYFYFDFVDDDKKKLAYAVSFGQSEDHAPADERKVISAYMSRMDGISVREEDGVRICCEDYGVKAEYVIDPVFLADPRIYKPIIEKSSHRENKPFMVTYILDPTPEKCEAARHIAKKLGGIKIISLLDGLPWTFKKNRAKTSLPNCVENLQVEDWLYYLSHAEFVLTDSFHGSAFAIIFKKRFISLTNKLRGLSRFKSLAGMFGFEDRLVDDPKRVMRDDYLLESLDYDKIDSIIKEERKRCLGWLKTKLDEPKKAIEGFDMKRSPMSRVITKNLDMNMCMGCGACMSACPKDAIKLEQDEMGYYRPTVSYGKCVDCGICTKVCPAHQIPEKKNTNRPQCFEFMAASDETLMASSSGGAFPVLAKEAFRRSGAVVGAAWGRAHIVEHTVVAEEKDLHKLQKSKYLQSYLGTIFRDVKTLAEKGRFVLFSGCPCQVAGLRKYLGRDYENILMIDLLCGNSPSAGFFEKYLSDSFPGGIKSYEFRYKGQGWNSDCVKVILKNDTQEIRRGVRDDDYQRVYHNHVMCATHCEKCKYQSLPRYGDITIGDFWGIGERHEVKNKEKGVSVILCNNEKGRSYLSSIPSSVIGMLNEVPLHWLGGNGYAIGRSHNYADPRRNMFYEVVKKMPFHKAVDYALKPSHGEYLKQKKNVLLEFDSRKTVFSFDAKVWEEHRIKEKIVLFARNHASPPGLYATLPLDMPLKRGKTYILHTKFKVRTTSDFFNFHIKDSGSPAKQVIFWYKIMTHDDEWVEIKHEFVPNSDIYDEFAFGASQLSGENAYFAIEYIRIEELVNQSKLMNQAWDIFSKYVMVEADWKKVRGVIKQIDDIDIYLELLLIISRKYMVILSVRDTPGSELSDDIIERILALGFTHFSKELWRMYVGIMDAGEVLYNQSGDAREKPVSVSMETSDHTASLTITSQAWRQGDKSEILINGVDYSANQRGINIVVYDKEKHEVWDSIAYDAHDNGIGFIRKKFE